MCAWLPRFDQNICTGCGNCITACLPRALSPLNGKAALVYPNLCTYCAACELACPVGAVELLYLVCKLEDFNEQTNQS
jgi:ferredoxin